MPANKSSTPQGPSVPGAYDPQQGEVNTLRDWAMMLPFILLASVAAEVTKVFLRRRAGRVEIARELSYEIG